ncbi:MAG: G-D-S-L family lipolytic protein [Bacteroidia bacterium]|nr:G-D-S-L family lipolytic protein [Bacteroidia bacterium]NNM22926.1 G-D-S-L family lipolytic protein [Flavobacteriaceae bacterium]
MKTKYIWLFALSMALIGCEADNNNMNMEEPAVELTAGSADFSKYVAVGASFTAGFTDGALFIASQENSFPNILAQQFAELGGGTMTQPLMNDNIGGLLLGGVQIQNPRLYFDGSGPAFLDAMPTTEVSNVLGGPFTNMGVPGAKSFHLLANGYGNVGGVPTGQANPYFARMASSPNASILEDALAQGASFFTLSEMGGNDVLGFATSGGSGVDQTGNFDPTTYGPNDITDPLVFANTLSIVVDALTANGAQGVITSVPYVTSLPYFTTVPYNPVPLDDATAALLNGAYAPYNGGLLQAEGAGLISAEEREARTIVFAAGKNPVVIEDEDLTDLSGLGLPNYRQTTPADLPVLPSASFIGTLVNNDPLLINGLSVPLTDQWVLTVTETDAVIAATDAYNVTIEGIAASKSLAFLDLKAILQQASTTGIIFDDFTMDTGLVFGGLVSLDGVHLTARGYALMANKFLEAIDATYGSNFHEAGKVAKANDFIVSYPPVL